LVTERTSSAILGVIELKNCGEQVKVRNELYCVRVILTVCIGLRSLINQSGERERNDWVKIRRPANG